LAVVSLQAVAADHVPAEVFVMVKKSVINIYLTENERREEYI